MIYYSIELIDLEIFLKNSPIYSSILQILKYLISRILINNFINLLEYFKLMAYFRLQSSLTNYSLIKIKILRKILLSYYPFQINNNQIKRI